MHLGPGVYVGPIFIVAGLLLIIWRRPVGHRLGKVWPRHELATPVGAASFGISSVIGGGIAVLAGFGITEWWPL
ncbi:hypothetical protein [Kineococcus sp. R86509]|uniref:hypothetical protein n=1 Tax=Kineococcus sp. R86509 TaxID=3093851 RepID=UPI0036D3E4BB